MQAPGPGADATEPFAWSENPSTREFKRSHPARCVKTPPSPVHVDLVALRGQLGGGEQAHVHEPLQVDEQREAG
jgi:hypothetical protein